MKEIVLILAVVASTVGCGEKLGYDEGYADGYAVGYNSTCEIRKTVVHGDWGNAEYSRGYADGQLAGSAQCLKDGGPGKWDQ